MTDKKAVNEDGEASDLNNELDALREERDVFFDAHHNSSLLIKKLEKENERLLREWHKAYLAKINAEKGTCYHFALNPYDLENMLNCLVDEKISVKKAIELIASWVARNYSDDCLPS